MNTVGEHSTVNNSYIPVTVKKAKLQSLKMRSNRTVLSENMPGRAIEAMGGSCEFLHAHSTHLSRYIRRTVPKLTSHGTEKHLVKTVDIKR